MDLPPTNSGASRPADVCCSHHSERRSIKQVINPKGNGLSGQVASHLISANHLEVEVNSMLMKCVGEAKLGGASGAGVDRGNKTKGFGEVGKTNRELELDVWLGNNLKEYKRARELRYKATLGHLGGWGGIEEQIQLLPVIQLIHKLLKAGTQQSLSIVG